MFSIASKLSILIRQIIVLEKNCTLYNKVYKTPCEALSTPLRQIKPSVNMYFHGVRSTAHPPIIGLLGHSTESVVKQRCCLQRVLITTLGLGSECPKVPNSAEKCPECPKVLISALIAQKCQKVSRASKNAQKCPECPTKVPNSAEKCPTVPRVPRVPKSA